MQKVTVANLRKHLKMLDKKQLEDLIVDLFKSSKEVKEALTFEVLGEVYGEEILNDYKKKIKREIDKIQTMFSLRTLNGYLSSFKTAVRGNDKLYADLTLFYAEKLTDWMKEYWLPEEAIENAVIRLVKNVLKLAKKDKSVYDRLEDRIKAIMRNDFLQDYDTVAHFIDEYIELPWLTQEEREEFD